MTERDERGRDVEQRLSKRFETDEPAQTDNPSKTDTSSKTDMNAAPTQTDESPQDSVKDRPSVLMYLPDETRQELDIRFDELNAKFKREHGEALEKNRDYYPAVVEAGLTGKDLEDILDL